MTEQILDQLNPDKLGDLTTEQFQAIIKDLTAEDYKILAQTYPNKPKGNSYLILSDSRKKPENQINPRSTWYNYNELITSLGQKDYSILNTAKNWNPSVAGKQAVAPVQDLTKADLKSAEGLTGKTQTATALNGKEAGAGNKGTAVTTGPAKEGKIQDLTKGAIDADKIFAELAGKIAVAGSVEEVVNLVGDSEDPAVTEAANNRIVELGKDKVADKGTGTKPVTGKGK